MLEHSQILRNTVSTMKIKIDKSRLEIKKGQIVSIETINGHLWGTLTGKVVMRPGCQKFHEVEDVHDYAGRVWKKALNLREWQFVIWPKFTDAERDSLAANRVTFNG